MQGEGAPQGGAPAAESGGATPLSARATHAVWEALADLADRVGAAAAAVYTLDDEGTEANAVATVRYLPAALELVQRLPLDAPSIVARALRTGEPQCFPAAGPNPDPTDLGLTRQEFELLGLAAGLALPIRGDGRTFGALVYGLVERHTFSDRDVERAHALAAGVAPWLERVRLDEAAARRLREATVLTEIVTLAAGEADLERILATTLERLRGLIPFTGGSIALVEGNDLVVRAAVGPFAGAARGRRLPPGQGRSWNVVTDGEPFLSDDLVESGQAEIGRSGPLAIRSNLAVPLRWRSRDYGVLEVESTRPSAFRRRDLDLLGSVAAALSGPIELARRFGDEQVARQHLEGLAAERSAILGQIADGVIITDPDGRITFVNGAAERIHGRAGLGVGPDDYTSAFGLLTAAGEPFPTEQLALVRAVRGGETVVDAEWRVRRPDGTEVAVQGSATPVVGEGGTRLGAVLTLRDVTAQRDLDRQKVEFLSTVSHDLKNPLVTIKGLAQLLRRRTQRLGTEDGAWLAERLTLIDEAGNRMTNMINELVDVARLQMGQRLRLQRRPTDLVGLVRRATEERQKLADHQTLRVEVELDECILPLDAVRIERVLANLLSNAVKYSPDGGEVVARVWREGTEADGWAAFSVGDHGLGIPADDLPHIFERFHRGENVADQFAGSGIGLAGAKQIVEQHGGRLTAESREGAGSTFTVRLPLVPPVDQVDE